MLQDQNDELASYLWMAERLRETGCGAALDVGVGDGLGLMILAGTLGMDRTWGVAGETTRAYLAGAHPAIGTLVHSDLGRARTERAFPSEVSDRAAVVCGGWRYCMQDHGPSLLLQMADRFGATRILFTAPAPGYFVMRNGIRMSEALKFGATPGRVTQEWSSVDSDSIQVSIVGYHGEGLGVRGPDARHAGSLQDGVGLRGYVWEVVFR